MVRATSYKNVVEKLVKTTDASPLRGYSAFMSEKEKWIEEARPAIEEGIRILNEKGPSLARYRQALMTNSNNNQPINRVCRGAILLPTYRRRGARQTRARCLARPFSGCRK